MMAGIEQPLGGVFRRRVSVIADWYSGRHNLAAAIPAVQFTLPREWIFIASWRACAGAWLAGRMAKSAPTATGHARGLTVRPGKARVGAIGWWATRVRRTLPR